MVAAKPATLAVADGEAPLRAALYLGVHGAAGRKRPFHSRSATAGDGVLQGEGMGRRHRVCRCGPVQHRRQPAAASTPSRHCHGRRRPPFDAVVVHSFSRFAREHFALEYHVRRLRKHNVRLVSITQDLGDDPMNVTVRQVFALFGEYQSKENAKHVLRATDDSRFMQILRTNGLDCRRIPSIAV